MTTKHERIVYLDVVGVRYISCIYIRNISDKEQNIHLVNVHKNRTQCRSPTHKI
jgi:hypothetical protein